MRRHVFLIALTTVAVLGALFVASFLDVDKLVKLGLQASDILWDVILVVAVVTVAIMLSRLIPKEEY